MVDFKKSEDDTKVKVDEALSEAFDNADEKTKVNNVFKLLGILAVALGLGFGGYHLYQSNQEAKMAEAITEFDTLQNAMMSNNATAMKASIAKLTEQFPENPISVRGALMMSKFYFEGKDYKNAKTQLQWVIDHTKEQDIKIVSQMRLSKVLIEENQLDQALNLINSITPDGYEILINDTKGDIFVLKKDLKQAKQFYQQALNRITEKGNPLKVVLEMKIASLGDV